MHILYVICSVILALVALMRWYLGYLAGVTAEEMKERKLFETESELYFAYGLATSRPEQAGEERLAALKERYEKVSKAVEPYYLLIWARGWCDKLLIALAPMTVLPWLFRVGAIR